MTRSPPADDPQPGADGQRIDKWLWAARFFKTRSAAAAAVTGGKIEVDGDRVKPSRRLRAGNRLRIRRGVLEFTVHVLAFCEQRRPATEARTLYQETPESLAARTAEQARRTQAERLRSQRLGRPDKHARRQIARLKGHS